MTGEVPRLINVKNMLNEISPSFCTAKWLQVTLHLQNGRTHSCHHPMHHKIPLSELENNPAALHNTSHKLTQRRMMMEGVRPPECQYCWNVEDLPGNLISDRYMKSGDLIWSEPVIQDVIDAGPSDDKFAPSYMELSFSNLCNFKCSYCSPMNSSKWVEEAKEHGPYPTSQNFNGYDWMKNSGQLPIHHNDPNPYVDAFWEWWPDLYKTLKVFRITGGEPLLERNTYRVLDEIAANPKSDLEISVNTNCCVPESKLNNFIDKMKQIEGKINMTRIYSSVDAWGEHAEYIRDGLSYDTWYKTVDRMLTELPLTKMTIMCTTNLLSVVTFKKLMEDIYFLKMKHFSQNRKVPITIDPTMLRFPGHMRLDLLPEEYYHYLEEALEYMQEREEGVNENPYYRGFFDFEIARVKRAIEYMKSESNENNSVDMTNLRSDFYLFVNEYDKRRDRNFIKTYPEYFPFYELCKEEYKTMVRRKEQQDQELGNV